MARALINIDMIKEFDTGLFANPRFKLAVPAAIVAENTFHANGELVIKATDGHDESDRESRKTHLPFHAPVGSEEAELVEGLREKEGELRLVKQNYDAFVDTDLEEILREKGIQEVVLVGVLADICVYETAMGAYYRDFKVTIVTDAVEVAEALALGDADEYKEFVLGRIQTLTGAKLVTASEL